MVGLALNETMAPSVKESSHSHLWTLQQPGQQQGPCPAGWCSAGPGLRAKLSLGRAGQAVLCTAAPYRQRFHG